MATLKRHSGIRRIIMNSEVGATQAAQLMVELLTKSRFSLYQKTAAREIQKRWPELVYLNENGHLAIRRTVLAEFRRLTGESVRWSDRGKHWRKKSRFDTPGKRRVR